VRVYIPGSARLLAELVSEGRLAGPVEGFGVTAEVRAALVGLDDEECEYAAFLEAAHRSLALLDDGPMRRVVVAADVPGAATGAGFAGVVLSDGLRFAQVAAVHADEAAAEGAVAAARADSDAAGLDDHDLLWFATQEVADLLAALGGPGPGGGPG
jgi:phage terminase large subunit-like protein